MHSCGGPATTPEQQAKDAAFRQDIYDQIARANSSWDAERTPPPYYIAGGGDNYFNGGRPPTNVEQAAGMVSSKEGAAVLGVLTGAGEKSPWSFLRWSSKLLSSGPAGALINVGSNDLSGRYDSDPRMRIAGPAYDATTGYVGAVVGSASAGWVCAPLLAEFVVPGVVCYAAVSGGSAYALTAAADQGKPWFIEAADDAAKLYSATYPSALLSPTHRQEQENYRASMQAMKTGHSHSNGR